jgi:hypothetical protein
MTLDAAHDYAALLCETGSARVCFVTVAHFHSLTLAGFTSYDVAQYQTVMGSPIGRYMRLSTGAVTYKAVSDWRRN